MRLNAQRRTDDDAGMDMKDWPVGLRFNAAHCQLAQDIYARWREAYGGQLDWAELSQSKRDELLLRALNVLLDLKPGKVIPYRSESEPYGVETEKS